MEIFLTAAIERVENGESMHSEAVTQGEIERQKEFIRWLHGTKAIPEIIEKAEADLREAIEQLRKAIR